jgi:hypothetical protein
MTSEVERGELLAIAPLVRLSLLRPKEYLRINKPSLSASISEFLSTSQLKALVLALA